VDPLAEETMDSFGYCYQSPINYFEPDGCSPISILLKMMLKKGAKEGLKSFAEKQIKNKIERYVTKLAKGQYKKLGKELGDEIEKILGDLDEEWWETAIELVPIAGDAYGTTKFGIKLKRAYDKMQDLENKYIGKLHDLLPKSLQEELKKKSRRKGVRDAKVDQKAGARNTEEYDGEEIYVKAKKDDIENQIEGDHIIPVIKDPSKMQDPRNIRFKTNANHKEKTRSENTKGGKKVHRSSRNF
jgi:hypothetical protein